MNFKTTSLLSFALLITNCAASTSFPNVPDALENRAYLEAAKANYFDEDKLVSHLRADALRKNRELLKSRSDDLAHAFPGRIESSLLGEDLKRAPFEVGNVTFYHSRPKKAAKKGFGSRLFSFMKSRNYLVSQDPKDTEGYFELRSVNELNCKKVIDHSGNSRKPDEFYKVIYEFCAPYQENGRKAKLPKNRTIELYVEKNSVYTPRYKRNLLLTSELEKNLQYITKNPLRGNSILRNIKTLPGKLAALDTSKNLKGLGYVDPLVTHYRQIEDNFAQFLAMRAGKNTDSRYANAFAWNLYQYKHILDNEVTLLIKYLDDLEAMNTPLSKEKADKIDEKLLEINKNLETHFQKGVVEFSKWISSDHKEEHPLNKVFKDSI